MKAVVATSRMHEGSRRRTDSCEIPGSAASRQSSMQQDPPPEASSPEPADKETPPPDQEPPKEDQSKSADQRAPSPSPPRSPKPPSSAPTRPPLRADGLRQASFAPRVMPVLPHPPQKSYSVVEPAPSVQATPSLNTPLSPGSISNGFMPGAEPATKTTHCQ